MDVMVKPLCAPRGLWRALPASKVGASATMVMGAGRGAIRRRACFVAGARQR